MAQPQPPDVAAFMQAVAAALNAQPPAPNPPPVPAPFALLPGDAYTAPLDYNKPNELKIFKSATASMQDKFDLKEEHLRVFLETVKEQVRTYDWIHIITVPDDNAINRDLTTNYGQVTRANVQAHAATYIGQQNRHAQNAMMLYKYLLNSLTDEAKLMMLTLKEQYHVNNVPDGIMLLKAIIGRSSIDTKAKVLLLRESVSHLYIKMAEVKGNVREFNDHVSEVSAALRGRGHEVQELEMHLFKAYEQVPDQQFNRYIETLRNQYEQDEDINAERLMQLAVAKYDLISQRNAMPSDTNAEKIVALQAKIKELKTGKKDRKGKFKAKDSWKLEPPKTGEPITKVVNGRNYNYCKFHKQWTAHSPSKCKLNPDYREDQDAAPAAPSADAEADRLVINRAYHAIIYDDDDDDSNSMSNE
jgi:hypothetical protein